MKLHRLTLHSFTYIDLGTYAYYVGKYIFVYIQNFMHSTRVYIVSILDFFSMAIFISF